jgi:diadenosine tetraphosphate (Ap4A) HIT family hydrolase
LTLALSASPAEANRTRAKPAATRAKAKKPQLQKPRSSKPNTQRITARHVRHIQRQPHPFHKHEATDKKTIAKFVKDQRAWIRQRGKIFKKIAVQRNYKNDYVVHRDKTVTAFLDWSDPSHPMFKPDRRTGEQRFLDKIPMDRRAHILVVPNKPREHIGESLGSQINSKDLSETLKTVKAAEKLAKSLGIKNPRVWVNSESSISVGYLHVHILGEKTKAYPDALKAPRKSKKSKKAKK